MKAITEGGEHRLSILFMTVLSGAAPIRNTQTDRALERKRDVGPEQTRLQA